jgi:hypothetical protein
MKMKLNELRNLIKRVIKEELEDDAKESRIEELKLDIKRLSRELADAPNNEKQIYRDQLALIAQELKMLREKPKDTTPNYKVEYLYDHEEGRSSDSFEIYVENPSEVKLEVNKRLKQKGSGFGTTLISIYDLKNNRYIYKNERTGGGYSKRDTWY